MSTNPERTPPVLSFFPTAIFLFFIGWGGLFVLVNESVPTVGPRWLFFFLLVIALTGTILPAAAFLNRRFPSAPPATSVVVVRQSLWIGVYGATLAWLQIGRVLNLGLALLLLVGVALIEFMLRLSERSRWKP